MVGVPLNLTLGVMNEDRTPTIVQLLESVGLPETFLDQLLTESDWSLIIKLHAVFEAVLASLIVRRLGTPQTAEVVSHLDFNNTKSGKVALARALGLIESCDAAFLRGLSELRNRLVHNIRNVAFTFSEHIATLTPSELKKFKSEFGFAICQLDDGESKYVKILKNHPRTIVYLAAHGCLLNMQFHLSTNNRNLIVEALMRRSAK